MHSPRQTGHRSNPNYSETSKTLATTHSQIEVVVGLGLGRCKELWGSYEALFAASLWFPKPQNRPNSSFSQLQWIWSDFATRSKHFSTWKTIVTVFLLVAQQSAKHLRVLGWLGGPAPLCWRLPRPAIRQITTDPAPNPSLSLVSFQPTLLSQIPLCPKHFNLDHDSHVYPARPKTRFFSVSIFPTYHTQMLHWNSLFPLPQPMTESKLKLTTRLVCISQCNKSLQFNNWGLTFATKQSPNFPGMYIRINDWPI